MIYFTADTHFFHRNIILYCNRPFQFTDEMNEAMIERWNSKVSDTDSIYHLGDFGWMKYKTGKEGMREVFIRLNGKKFLCKGSHDSKLIKMYPEFFEEIRESFVVDKRIFLSHYFHYVWPLSHYGTWHLFGHNHGSVNSIVKDHGKCMDVGVDTNDFYPYSIDEIEVIMKTRPKNFNERKK